MSQVINAKRYDLEERTYTFARNVISFYKELPKTAIEGQIVKQLVRSATSVGANYIESNESLSKKDFLMRIKICRKEAKESGYWLRPLETDDQSTKRKQDELLRESVELTKIFGSIVSKN